MKGYIHSIETMGTVDGPGIRFVVFLQGCPMRCKYCHNPDTWQCGVGMIKSPHEILDQYERYLPYLKNGGITVTGGEPLLQIEFVTDLFQEAKRRKIHTCLDTSGITFDKKDQNKKEKFFSLMNVTDLVMLDIKHINAKAHLELTGMPAQNVLDFVEYLEESNVEVWIRHVVVPGLTDDRESLEKLGGFIGRLRNVKAIDILPYHAMGKSKYKKLKITYPLEDTPECTQKEALLAKEMILEGVRKVKVKNKSF